LTFIARIVQDIFKNIDPLCFCAIKSSEFNFFIGKIHGLQYKLMRDAP